MIFNKCFYILFVCMLFGSVPCSFADSLGQSRRPKLVICGVSFRTMTRYNWGVKEIKDSYDFQVTVRGTAFLDGLDPLSLLKIAQNIKETCPKNPSTSCMRLLCEVYVAGEVVEVIGYSVPYGQNVWVSGAWYKTTSNELYREIERYLPLYIVPAEKQTGSE